MEKIKHPMGEAMKNVAYLDKEIRLKPVLDIKINFAAGGLISSMYRMASEISKRYDTTVTFELYDKTVKVSPDTNIEELYTALMNKKG